MQMMEEVKVCAGDFNNCYCLEYGYPCLGPQGPEELAQNRAASEAEQEREEARVVLVMQYHGPAVEAYAEEHGIPVGNIMTELAGGNLPISCDPAWLENALNPTDMLTRPKYLDDEAEVVPPISVQGARRKGEGRGGREAAKDSPLLLEDVIRQAENDGYTWNNGAGVKAPEGFEDLIWMIQGGSADGSADAAGGSAGKVQMPKGYHKKVVAYVGSEQVLLTLDSGSYRNAISEEYLQKLQSKEDLRSRVTATHPTGLVEVGGAQEGMRTSYKAVTAITVTFRDATGRSATVDAIFVVIRGLAGDMLLGCPTLDRLSYAQRPGFAELRDYNIYRSGTMRQRAV